MLVVDRGAALTGVEEDAAEMPVHLEHDQRRQHRRACDDHRPARDRAEKVKAGNRRQARPGARILAIVTERLIDCRMMPRTAIPTATIQTSGPLLEMKIMSESGGQLLKPVSGGV